VLYLDQGYVGSPWYDEFSSRFRDAIGPTRSSGIATFAEHLDFGHFGSESFEKLSRDYLGSTSSKRAAASRASAPRPRWAKADAKQRQAGIQKGL
jgi:hypothetical protein